MNTRRINKSQKGFTLVEMTVTLLCVTLVTGLFLVLTALAKDTYVQMEETSEGQVLCSNLANAIQGELRFATYIEYDRSSSENLVDFTYYSENLGVGDGCKIVDSYDILGTGDGAYVQNGANTSDSKGFKSKLYVYQNGKSYELVSDKTYIFNIEALVDVKFDKTTKDFYVTIRVVDGENYSNDHEIIKNTFKVVPLNKQTLY